VDNGDDFATDSSSTYSRDSYYIGATDSRGHGTKSYVNVPPQVKGEISALLASRSFPAYRTEADLYRDAIVHRLHDLSEMMKDGSPVASGRLEILSRRLIVESELEYERRMIESDEAIALHAEFLMQHPPSFATVSSIERAVTEVGDRDIKERLTRELDMYKRRYQLKD
jgi:hypothetical protein